MNNEARMIFGIADDPEIPGNRVVVLGISGATWDHIKAGNTCTVDLTRVGLPIQVIVYGGPTQDACRKMLTLGPNAIDLGDRDMGIG